MSRPKFIDQISRLKIPSRCKAELALLYAKCQRLAAAILRFLKSHRRFGESMILGCVVAYLLGQVPWLGAFLALCALVTAAAIGMMRELREDLSKFFDIELPAAA